MKKGETQMSHRNSLTLGFAIATSTFILAFAPAVFPQPNRSGAGFIQKFDKNNDEKVSREEFFCPDKAFERLDRNQDGYIDENEATRGCPRHGRRGRNFIQNFDKDGDGRVARAEFTGCDKLFDRLDQNGDGFIDDTEAPKAPPPKGRFIRDGQQQKMIQGEQS
jgi:Ca2+-binding EF-hand superfamily protein